MKKWIFIFVVLVVSIFATSTLSVAVADTGLSGGAKAVYLTDMAGQVEMVAENADERYPIASMVKIMTALLTLESMEAGRLSPTEGLTISSEAMGMGGSQMFLNAGDVYPAVDLLKGVIVVSANDACVALAERLCGTEGAFVEQMNARALELGMRNTHFANCTGLPHPEGYSSARDVAKMLGELVRYPLYHELSSIWMEDYHHPDGRVTTLTNTNKLVRFYDGCDGGKTGYTAEAGFCLAVSAHKGDTQLVGVVIGAKDSKKRFATATGLLNYGFSHYKMTPYLCPDEGYVDAPVVGGSSRVVPAKAERMLGLVEKLGNTTEAEIHYEWYSPAAPIEKGSEVGRAYLCVDGVAVGECAMVAVEGVEKGTYGDAIEDFLGYYALP
ncbi:MAG: D-alanyl-D-alanine carboxypeptidase [Clostridia bacterium]|nr:D-alanyl-D-alanine carboxypeptidase [Clostridia bacterium]